jgi:hypothetical protein
MATRLEISLELELTEPVSGTVRPAGGDEQRFAGWLELNSALERLCRGAEQGDESELGNPGTDASKH